MKKEKQTPYNKEQAEQMLMDYNAFIDCNLELEEGDIKFISQRDIKFINHKFPPKIEYIGKVWKTTNGIIFLCDKEADNGNLGGYGLLNSGSWFKANAVSHNLNVTQATPTEWMDALDKFAESKYNVGDKVESLVVPGGRTVLQTINSPKRNKLQMNQYWGLATKTATGVLLMQDGIWADIITPAKDELNEKLKELTKLAESQGKNLKITFEKQ